MIDGQVIQTGFNDSYGNFVHIKISDNIYITYNHLNKVLVKNGQKVASGQIIAKSGNTGNSTGPHLHLEMYVNNRCVNILPFVKYDYTENFAQEYADRGEIFIYENSN